MFRYQSNILWFYPYVFTIIAFSIFLLLILFILISSLFASSLEERVSNLEKRVANLEKQLKVQNNIIENNQITNCNKLKIVKFDYKYNNAGMIQSYVMSYTFKNNYKKPVEYIYVNIEISDNEDTVLLEDYVKKSIIIKPNQSIKISTNYIFEDDSLAAYLKTTPKSKIHLTINPYLIKFSDNTTIKCK